MNGEVKAILYRATTRYLDGRCAFSKLRKSLRGPGSLPGAGLVLLCLLLAPLTAFAQGFAGLGSDGNTYAPVRPGTPITFPQDHGAHPGHRIEWWYVTANLIDGTGAPLGVQWTLFRQATAPDDTATGWASQQYWMGHTAVTTADTHRHAERLSRGGIGQAGVRAAPFTAWIDDWSFDSTGTDFAPLILSARGENFAYTLTLSTDAPMVLQGEGGYSRKSDRGQASYYVSQPFFTVSGKVAIDGESRAVTGRAWMDREWSSQPLAPDQTGWDWFSLHLDSGAKLMLFRLRSETRPPYFAGNWITPDGTSTALAPGAITMEPLENTTVAGRTMPVKWRLAVAGRALDVTVEALNPDSWNATSFPYWEGPITVTGSQGGTGYLEMTGYPADE